MDSHWYELGLMYVEIEMFIFLIVSLGTALTALNASLLMPASAMVWERSNKFRILAFASKRNQEKLNLSDDAFLSTEGSDGTLECFCINASLIFVDKEDKSANLTKILS